MIKVSIKTTVNSEIYVNNVKNFTIDAWFNYISKRQSDFYTSRGFHFCETTHPQSFVKIKPFGKFLNLQCLTVIGLFVCVDALCPGQHCFPDFLR